MCWTRSRRGRWTVPVPPAADRRPPTADCGPSALDRRPPAPDCCPSAADHGQRVVTVQGAARAAAAQTEVHSSRASRSAPRRADDGRVQIARRTAAAQLRSHDEDADDEQKKEARKYVVRSAVRAAAPVSEWSRLRTTRSTLPMTIL